MISVLSAVAGPGLGVGLNLSRSAPRGLYRAVANTPVRGALVVACLPATVAAFGHARGYLGVGGCPGGTQPVLKRIGAVAGDVLELGGVAVTVSGAPLLTQQIETVDSAARLLPHIAFGSYLVGNGQVWLFGLAHCHSWDSRYFGPVPVTAVRSVARPVFTLD